MTPVIITVADQSRVWLNLDRIAMMVPECKGSNLTLIYVTDSPNPIELEIAFDRLLEQINSQRSKLTVDQILDKAVAPIGS